jgi:hypothetical protein
MTSFCWSGSLKSNQPGRTTVLGVFARADRASKLVLVVGTAMSAPGQHTSAVLQEHGYNRDEIAGLMSRNVITAA